MEEALKSTKPRLRPLVIGGLAGLALLASVPLALADDVVVVTDIAGDTVDDSDDSALSVPQADILTSSIAIRPEGIVLQVKVQNPTAPLSDVGWDGASSIDWDLDTTGDGTADFVADYFVDSDTGRLTGDVYRPDEDDDGALCDVKATSFSPDSVYTAVLDPVCIGSPTTIAYQVSFFYDTNPDDDDAPVGADHAPDVALSAPVGSAKAPVSSAPPTSASPAPVATPAPATPVASTPAPPVVAPASPPASTPAPAPAHPGANPVPARPATSPGVPTAPAPGVQPVLAATGAAQTGDMATLGSALVILGVASLVLRGRTDDGHPRPSPELGWRSELWRRSVSPAPSSSHRKEWRAISP